MKILSDFLQVVLGRAEGPKALSPGQHPGYTSNLQCALQGQKLYITPIVFMLSPLSPPKLFRDDK